MSLDITQMPSKQRPANVLTLQAIELHAQKHRIPKQTSKQTGSSTLTVQIFPLKYVYYAFKNIWCQENLHSHTLGKHNLKPMLPKVQAGAQTDTKCTLSPHFTFTIKQLLFPISLLRWGHWGPERTKWCPWGHQHMSKGSLDSGNQTWNPSSQCHSHFRRLLRHAFNICHPVYLIENTKNSVCRSTHGPRSPWRSLLPPLSFSSVPPS